MKNIVKNIRAGKLLLFCAFIIFTNTPVLNAETNGSKREVPFTLEDRDRIIRIETKLSELEKRFDMMLTFIGILAGAFTGIVAVTIAFAIWDRRTMIRPFEEKVKKIEKDISRHEEELIKNKEKLSNLLEALRSLSEEDKKLAEILKKFNLL